MSHPRFEKRILIVENDEGVRETSRELLDKPGYRVFVASGIREQLVENALFLVQVERCHLVVLDLRLYSDHDPDDWSGYEFAERLSAEAPWVRCIFLTGYGSFELARRTLAAGNIAIDIALKEHGPAELVQMVQDVFQYKIACAWEQEHKWIGVKNSEDVLAPLMFMGEGQDLAPATMESEFAEILARLFPHADKLRLRTLGSDGASASITRVHSLLLRVSVHQNGNWLEDIAVKIGSRQNIARENKNYDEHVNGRIGDFRHTHRYAATVIWNLGGIAYTLVGTNLNDTLTFQEYYRAHAPLARRDTAILLGKLFEQLLKRWYAEPTSEPLNLWDHYRGELNLDDEHLARLEWRDEDVLEFSEPTLKLPNPLHWIERNKHRSELETSRHVVHGDLHTRNIFVGPNKGLWLIDFERTGPGHCLRDYIEMETDIKFSLLAKTHIPRALYYEFEKTLLSQSKSKLSGQTPPVPAALRAHIGLADAFRMITRLRQLAASRIQSADLTDYFWGLLGQTLFVATLADHPLESKSRAKMSVENKWRAKLSAALICERLEKGAAWQKGEAANKPQKKSKGRGQSAPKENRKGKKYEQRPARAPLRLRKPDPLDEEIELLERRLAARRKQQALKGIDTPPETIIEIEQLETNIATLRRKKNRRRKD